MAKTPKAKKNEVKNSQAFDEIVRKYAWKPRELGQGARDDDFGAKIGRDTLQSLKNRLVLPKLKIG